MWENRLLANFGAVCAFWLCANATAQRAVAPHAALSLEEKVGQMLQVRVYADDPNLQGQAFQRELQAVAACHAGSVDLRVRLEGPNLLRPNQDVVAHSLNGLQAASPIPLLLQCQANNSPDKTFHFEVHYVKVIISTLGPFRLFFAFKV
ncbi:MAG: hypothetical protein WCA21_17325 [Terracidiphilus sp.]